MSARRPLRAEDFEANERSELVRLCENLLKTYYESDDATWRRALADANRVLSKHDRGYVRGFFAACLEPIA